MIAVIGMAVLGVALTGASGLVTLAFPRGSVGADRLAAAVLGLGAALASVAAGATFALGPSSASLGALSARLDALSAVFLLQLQVISAAGAAYACAYWSPAERPHDARRLRIWYGATVAGIGTVLLAGDWITLLAGWETMAVGAFLALTTEERDPAVRAAGRLYLACTKVSTLALVAVAALWFLASGAFTLAPLEGSPPAVFWLALLGFGLKAGAMPMHVWLPSAHGSAPSHVSALMSGVLIKVGIYGLLRVLWLCAGPAWWGHAVFAVGAASSVLGVVFAIGQHDLKRLLAYHSIENIGIILLGVGLALTGRAAGDSALEALGLAGAVLHTFNHGLFKALLFLAAGSVIHATGERRIDRLGGLQRALPGTSLAFLTGAVAICGLPPLNGFVSEFLVYAGLLRTLVRPELGSAWLYGGLGTPALALTGALAVLCFAKVYGVAFLGEARAGLRAEGREARAMILPMAGLAACCAVVGVLPIFTAPLLDGAIAVQHAGAEPIATLVPLGAVTAMAVVLVTAFVVAAALLARRLAGWTPSVTWDCGYAAPAPRMQYTASSFAEPVVALFRWALLPERHGTRVSPEPFPPPAERGTHVRDPVLDVLLVPGVRALVAGARRLQSTQRRSSHAAVVYLFLAVGVVLAVAWSS